MFFYISNLSDDECNNNAVNADGSTGSKTMKRTKVVKEKIRKEKVSY